MFGGRWEGVGRALGGRWEGIERALGGRWQVVKVGAKSKSLIYICKSNRYIVAGIF